MNESIVPFDLCMREGATDANACNRSSTASRKCSIGAAVLRNRGIPESRAPEQVQTSRKCYALSAWRGKPYATSLCCNKLYSPLVALQVVCQMPIPGTPRGLPAAPWKRFCGCFAVAQVEVCSMARLPGVLWIIRWKLEASLLLLRRWPCCSALVVKEMIGRVPSQVCIGR